MEPVQIAIVMFAAGVFAVAWVRRVRSRRRLYGMFSNWDVKHDEICGGLVMFDDVRAVKLKESVFGGFIAWDTYHPVHGVKHPFLEMMKSRMESMVIREARRELERRAAAEIARTTT